MTNMYVMQVLKFCMFIWFRCLQIYITNYRIDEKSKKNWWTKWENTRFHHVI